MTANVLKGNGLFLLSCCNHHRSLLPATATAAASRLTLTGSSCPPQFKDNVGVRPCRPLSSCSLSGALLRIDKNDRNTNPTRRLKSECFCTASNVSSNSAAAASSVQQPIASNPTDNEGDGENPTAKVKDAANTLDIRIGRIIRAWRHEEADSLYVEEVDVGEPEPRIICSGLVKFMPLEHLQDRHVVVLANLKPRNMRGVKSYGMLMAASDESHDNVELLVPPGGSTPGERVWFGSADENENLPEVATANQIQKKKIWELVQPHLRTNDSCVAALDMHYMRTSAGVIVSKSLRNARIS